MATPRAGISGVAVTMIGVGALLVWSSINDVSPLDALRLLARGQVPTGKTPTSGTEPKYGPDPNWSRSPSGKLRDYPDSYQGDNGTVVM